MLTNLPSGQTTLTGLLPAAASTFGSVVTGWTSYGGSIVAQIPSIGRSALGALSVISAGPWTGATSSTFAATAGVHYSASTWVKALTAGHSVAIAFQFRDASGALITSLGTQMSQPITDTTTGWTQTPPVVGFAPPGAVTGSLIFLDFDGPAGDVQRLDDVSVSSTTGVAAKIVGPLKTQGTNVLDGLGRVVHFHGVDIDGLQYSNTANVTPSEVSVAQAWGANFVRLPLAENYLMPGDCSYDSTYLSKVDAMVNAATSQGIFIMLDLHTNALTACAAPAQQDMPDANAVTVWTTLANRYKSNPLVGFDLYNEPHDVSDAVWHSGGTVTSSGVTYQAVGMQTLYNTVRATGATNLVFASGSNWATSFPATAPLTGTSNLIYAAHAYTCPTGLAHERRQLQHRPGRHHLRPQRAALALRRDRSDGAGDGHRVRLPGQDGRPLHHQRRELRGESRLGRLGRLRVRRFHRRPVRSVEEHRKPDRAGDERHGRHDGHAGRLIRPAVDL